MKVDRGTGRLGRNQVKQSRMFLEMASEVMPPAQTADGSLTASAFVHSRVWWETTRPPVFGKERNDRLL